MKKNSNLKTYLFLAAVMMLPWFGEAVSIGTLRNDGPLSVKWMVSTQGLVDTTVLAKTNTTATSTNTTQVIKSTVTNSMFQADDLLALLENSFNTNYPAGTQLVLSRVGDFVFIYLADATGTNIVQPLSTNLIFGTYAGEQPVHSDLQTVITRNSASSSSASDTSSETVTETMALTYDDSGLATKDGTHSQFQVTCLLVRKSSEDFVSQKIKDQIKMQFIGFGTIRGQNVIIQGSGGATITGLQVLPV
jgi:hypothetical protein